MIYRFEDPAQDWDAKCDDDERELLKYPKCDKCGTRLTEDVYVVDGYRYCADCMDELYKHDASEFVKEEWDD